MRKRPTKRPSAIPSPGEGKRGSGGYLAYLLRQANAAVRLALERELADLNITPPQFSTLTMIAAYQSLSGADLARLTMLTPQTINVIVRNLERRRAVVKEPDRVHGRILRLSITDEGKRLLDQCKSRADAIEARLKEGLPRTDEQAVRTWLADIAGTLPLHD